MSPGERRSLAGEGWRREAGSAPSEASTSTLGLEDRIRTTWQRHVLSWSLQVAQQPDMSSDRLPR